MGFLKCPTKGCVYDVLPGKTHCRNHLDQPEIPTPAKTSPDVEIVKFDSIPNFRILNKRSYDLARTVITLQPEHALKIKVLSDKERTPLGASVLNYCKKLGTPAQYRSAPGCIYVWKKAAKGAASKKTI